MQNKTSQPEPTYLQFRDRILTLDPYKLGLKAQFAKEVWGIIMEIGYEVGTASLVALADGTTSLYYSTGGGLLGSPDYAPVSEAAKGMVALAENIIHQASPTEKVDLPFVGQVRFTFLTFSGKLTTIAPEKTLASGEDSLSQLYHLGRETLTQLSLLKIKK